MKTKLTASLLILSALTVQANMFGHISRTPPRKGHPSIQTMKVEPASPRDKAIANIPQPVNQAQIAAYLDAVNRASTNQPCNHPARESKRPISK